jgi:3-oxoacyl-[acyl-carrier-protein] synthase-1/3-oxoacyl-[acyl-carrier-protein] synthase II
MSVAIIAFGALSALGEGSAAVSAGNPGEPARVVLGRDPELERAGLDRPFAARVPLSGSERFEDRAAAILTRVVALCATDLDRVLPGWRGERIGLAVGTSSGALGSAELVFSRLGTACEIPNRRLGDMDPQAIERAFYFAPVLLAAEQLGLTLAPVTLVLGACAASALAIGLAKRWLEEGRCDLVLAGGFDAVSVFVAAGFEVLRATTAELPPRPFRAARDGMALGEGAALVALVPSSRCLPLASETRSGASNEKKLRARAHVTGFGASSDAVHLTAPDRTGSGLARAAALALGEAGSPPIDLVSAHGTATPFSDAAEARALRTVLGDKIASQVVVHPFKAQVGHTLGASGVLEALVCADALERGRFPAAAGSGPMDPDTPIRLLPETLRGSPHTALKLSAAFGGANAALVLSNHPRVLAAGVSVGARSHAPREVYVSRAVHVALEPDAALLAAELGQPLERFVRADALTRMTLLAVGRLVARLGSLAGAGIVVGEAFATLETDKMFYARIEERGVRMAEPRRFPYTSPNAAPGECSVVFGLTGPGFAVGCGPCAGLEALAVGADLVRSGDAERAVVVAADAVGPAVRAMSERLGLDAVSGAVGVVVSRERSRAAYLLGETRLELGPWGEGPPLSTGHRALVPLVASEDSKGYARAPAVLEAGGPLGRSPVRSGAWALRATVRIEPV